LIKSDFIYNLLLILWLRGLESGPMTGCDSTEEEVAAVSVADGVSLEVPFAAKDSSASIVTETASFWIDGEWIAEVEGALAEYAAE
jgi:hypothetical protein